MHLPPRLDTNVRAWLRCCRLALRIFARKEHCEAHE